MKIVIFAGGSGTRFWPISREQYPKQFKPLLNGKSTFEVHMDNYRKNFNLSDIFIATTEKLSSTVKEIYPDIPLHNILTEPIRRDVGPAVALVMLKLSKMGNSNEPTAIVWGDNVIHNTSTYLTALRNADEMLKINPSQLIFLGEIPKFPNENLGWIELGKKLDSKNGIPFYEMKSFIYRPTLEKAKKWFKDKSHLWNTGYFVTTPEFILSQFQSQQPEMYKKLEIIKSVLDSDQEYDTTKKIYSELEPISFDNAILEGLDNQFTKVLGADFEWSDPGTLYALKQFLQPNAEQNATKGLVHNYKTTDSLVFNYQEDKLVATIGLNGFIVVNTPDAVLVCHKDQIPEIKDMLKKFEDTDLKKYL